MGNLLGSHRAGAKGRFATACFGAVASIVLLAVLFTGGCKSLTPLDTKPLDTAGMSYDAIQQAKALKITAPEVAQIATAREGGLSDSACVEILEIDRSRNQPFDGGDTLAGLVRVGISEDKIIELAKLNQLGLGAGELQAMKLAGLDDDILLAVAQRRAAGQPVLAGASLADLKNAGVGESTLFQLANRGVPDSEAGAIEAFRHHGATDAQILSRFAGS